MAEAPVRSAALEVTRIEPIEGWRPLELGEVLRYHRLLGVLAVRDVQARYKQTLAGVTWVVLQPVITMVVFSVFFGTWLGVKSGDSPYPVFTFCGLVPWTYFVHAVTTSSWSVVGNGPMITKVYFPRLLLPIASVVGGLVDLLTSLVVLVPLLWYYDIVPGVALVALPIFIVYAALTALAVGVWLAAISVRFHDVRQALPFVTQLGMFCTPVVYPLSVVPEAYRWLFALNPMTTVTEGFRWCLAGSPPPSVAMVLASTIVLAAVLIGGLFWFRREETQFADLV